MRFQNQVVIVTGGARGIGLATARKFHLEGAIVVIGDIDEDAAKKAADNMMCFSKHLDVTKRASVTEFVAWAVESFKRIDILVNNAGITRDATLIKLIGDKICPKMTDEQFDTVIAVNQAGTFKMTQEVACVMAEQGSGVILNASSIVSPGNFGQANYAGSKSAVESMTVTWSLELAKYGIRVAAIAPGFTDTEMVAAMPEEAKKKVSAKIPLGRMATADEIADAYVSLAHATYCTGVTLPVAGGLRV